MNIWRLQLQVTCVLLALLLIFVPFSVTAQDAPAASDPGAEETDAADSADKTAEKTENASGSAKSAVAPAEAKSPAAAAAAGTGSAPDKAQGPDAVDEDKNIPKPFAAVTLTITAKDFSAEESRAALDWSMRARLEETFQLIDPKRVGQLEHQAATATEEEGCISEECLRTLKRRLVTDRLFSVNFAPDEQLVKVSLILLSGDATILRSDSCPACTLEKARDMMLDLLDEVILADVEPPKLEAVVESVPEPPIKEEEGEKPEQAEEKGFSLPWWTYVAAGVLLIGVLGGGGSDSDGDGPAGGTTGSVGVSW